MKIQRSGEILLARDHNRGVQVTAELLNVYEHPAPHNMRTFFAKNDGDAWDYVNSSRQAHLSCTVAVYTAALLDGKAEP